MRTIIHWRKISAIHTQHIYIKHLRYNNNQIIITENFTIMAKKEKSAFMRWYESYRGQRAVGVVYNIGASIVIIGALFKILHWPLASQVLMVGMFTESFLFFIGVFEKPHPVYHWEDIFPQLLGQDCNPTIMEAHKDLPRPNFVGNIGGNGSVVETSAKEKGVSVPAVSEEDMKRLKEGIEKLGNTASQLASLGQLAEKTNNLSEKMDIAGKAAEGFAATQNSLKSASDALSIKYQELGQSYQSVVSDMEGVSKQVKEYGKGVEAVNVQLGSLNAVYELQLKNIQEQADIIKTQTAKIEQVSDSVDKMCHNSNSSQEASAAYLAAQQKLVSQITGLNQIYGNMLSALN